MLFTWPAELKPQARHLYHGFRGQRVLAAAAEFGWDVDTRPHLAFRNSRPSQRLYMNPVITVGEYVARWSGSDLSRIGSHEPQAIRDPLWPWLQERGYASAADGPELPPFLDRLGRRPAHLRPGLRLMRRWNASEVSALDAEGRLLYELRSEVNRLLAAAGDETLRRDDRSSRLRLRTFSSRWRRSVGMKGVKNGDSFVDRVFADLPADGFAVGELLSDSRRCDRRLDWRDREVSLPGAQNSSYLLIGVD